MLNEAGQKEGRRMKPGGLKIGCLVSGGLKSGDLESRGLESGDLENDVLEYWK